MRNTRDVGSGIAMGGAIGILCKIVDVANQAPHMNGISFVGFSALAVTIFVGSVMAVWGDKGENAKSL